MRTRKTIAIRPSPIDSPAPGWTTAATIQTTSLHVALRISAGRACAPGSALEAGAPQQRHAAGVARDARDHRQLRRAQPGQSPGGLARHLDPLARVAGGAEA